MGVSLSGLSSGFDWQSLIAKLREAEETRVTAIQTRRDAAQTQLTAWQTLNTKLSAVQSAAKALTSGGSLDLFTAAVAASGSTGTTPAVSATASSSAAPGSYSLTVEHLAQAEKIASNTFSARDTALGLSGTLLVNGRAVAIGATDTLSAIQTAFNTANSGENPSGVTAGIVRDPGGGYRLVLTSDTEGAEGIALANASAGDTLGALGFTSGGSALAHPVSGGALSARFSSATTSVESLLGIEAQNLSGAVTLNGVSVTLDLTDTLEGIRDALAGAGFSARVVTETAGGATTSRLSIEGLTTFADDGNVLQALGVVEGLREDTWGMTGSAALTTDGVTPATTATRLADLFGYLAQSGADSVAITGVTHGGAAVSTQFAIGAESTVSDLLSAVETAFGGGVTASLTAEGKIQVVDTAGAGGSLSLSLSANLAAPGGGALDFGAFGAPAVIRRTVLQAGENASFLLDGTAMTSATNSVSGVIPGVTLGLLREDPETPSIITVSRDDAAVEGKAQALVDAWNAAMTFMDGQLSYDEEAKKTGGALFGSPLLKSIKSGLQGSVLAQVSGAGAFSRLREIGITLGSDNRLSLDSTAFRAALGNDFNGVAALLGAEGENEDGLAARLSTEMDHLTDGIDGTVTLREEGTRGAIKTLETRMTATGERIERKMSLLEKRFQTMETALSQMQSLSSWLASQLSALGT